MSEIAKRHTGTNFASGRSIVRAVNYLADVQSTPSSATDTKVFDAVLAALLELAVPNVGISSEARPFFEDLRHGMVTAYADITP